MGTARNARGCALPRPPTATRTPSRRSSISSPTWRSAPARNARSASAIRARSRRPTGLIKNANSTRLNGQPLRADLERRLGREVRMQNDANCLAISEASDGAAAGYGIVFGVILGTGVGGGVVIDGRPLTGAQAIAGEWGHNPLPHPRDDERPGPRCYCGRTGCIETWLSGPRLQDEFHRRTGRTLRATDIAEAALAGDAQAAEQMEAYCDRLARALSGVINIIDPHAIVLGGGLSRIGLLYDRVPELWKNYVFSEPDLIVTKLVPPRFGDSSGVRGAACSSGRQIDHMLFRTASFQLAHDPRASWKLAVRKSMRA